MGTATGFASGIRRSNAKLSLVWNRESWLVTQRIIVLNLSALVSCAIAWFVAPLSTPRWILIVASVAVMGIVNSFIFLAPRLSKPPAAPRKSDSFQSTVIFIIVVILLIVQLLVRLGYLSYSSWTQGWTR